MVTLKKIISWVKELQFNSYFLFAVILITASLIRLMFLFQSYDDPYLTNRFADESSYHLWAKKIMQGDFLSDRAFFTSPLYAYFLAFFYTFFGDHILYVRIVQIFMGLLTIFIVYLCARFYFKSRLNLIPPFIMAISVGPICYEFFADKTTFNLFLFSLCIYFCIICLREQKHINFFVSGVVCAIASMSHVSSIIILFSLIVSIFTDRFVKINKKLLFVMFAIFGFIIGISPVALHNAIVSQDFVLIVSGGGQNFYIGNHQKNISGRYTSPDFALANLYYEEESFTNKAKELLGKNSLRPSEVSRFWFNQGLKDISQNPHLAIKRFFRKLRWVFHNEELTDTRDIKFYLPRYKIFNLPLIPFWVVSCVGLLGLGFSLKKQNFIFLNTIIIGIASLFSIYFVFGRYRLPLIIPLSICATFAVQSVGELLKDREWKKLGAILVVILSLSWLLLSEVYPKKNSKIDELNLAFTLLELGDLQSAETLFQEKHNYWNKGYLEIFRDRLNSAHIKQAEGNERKGRIAEAIFHYKRAIEAKTNDIQAMNNLGTIYLRLKNFSEATNWYQKVIKIHPNHYIAKINMVTVATLEGNIDEAIRRCERVLEMHPNEHHAHLVFSKLLLKQNNIQLAYEHLHNALIIKPDFIEAKKIMNKLIKLYPDLKNNQIKRFSDQK